MKKRNLRNVKNISLGTMLLIVLYLTNLYNYLLFHSLAEVFSVLVAFAVFIISWNSKRYLSNRYLIFIGISYLFVAALDLIHTFAYKGMTIFRGYDYYANQLAIAARYMQALSLLIAYRFFYKKNRMNVKLIIFIYTIILAIILAAIFVWRIFPICFVEGRGLTNFKIISEYIICFILIADIILLIAHRDRFAKKIYKYLFWSLVFIIISELCFTIYTDNYGFSNLVGHYLKIFSFYMMYKAIVEKGILEPYDIIFRELKEKERKLKELAITDNLTGAYNRRAAFEFLNRLLTQSKIKRESITICFIDIDKFKEINDAFGHAEGDEVLKAIVRYFNESARKSDCICRLGGDEFLAIFSNSIGQEAATAVEKMRYKLSNFTIINKKYYNIDFSYGLAEYNLEEEVDANTLIGMADHNMYKNKINKKLGYRL